MMMKINSRGGSFLSAGWAVLLVICLCALLPRDARAMSRQSLSAPEEAEAFVTTLLGNDAGSLDGVYELTPDMEKAVTESGGWTSLAKSLTALGKPDSIGPAYADTWKGRNVLRVPCIFSLARTDLVFVLEDGAIAGLVTDLYTGAGEVQDEEETAEEEKHSTEISLSVPVPALQGELPGTLSVPEGEGPFPVVILVHGSGPNNRDEEVMNVRPFRDLAEGLARAGIAVFRYDKRTYVYGQEMAEDTQVTLVEETIEDAVTAALTVSGQEMIDAGRIFILGHSLGAMAVPAIREQLEKRNGTAAGFIMMAPPARPLDVLMREQYEYLYSLLPEVTDEQLKEKEALFEALDMLENLEELPDETMIAGAYVPYWKWLRAYDAVAEAEQIREVCLLLQGEEDYQVTMEDFRLWEEAVGDRPGWKLISYPGLVHTFTKGEKKEGPDVYAAREHVDAQVISDIAAFVAAADAPSAALSSQAHSFDINRTYTAGEISLEVISVMIGGSAWIEENGEESHGYTIDVYYHVRTDEKSGKETLAYDLAEPRLMAGDQEYVLQNIYRSIEDTVSGRVNKAEPGNEWRTFCRSFCLKGNGPDGENTLPELLIDTPIKLQMKLTDKTSGAENEIEIEIN